MTRMNRRHFLRALSAAAGGAALWPAAGLGAGAEYTGRLLVTLQVEGGWDVTSFCDPKMNVPGELEINRWARMNETQSAGKIRFAPFAGNAAFFAKYHRYMLVINGVDAQTNSHTTGVVHNWSGRVSEGFPSLPALFSRIRAPDLPLAYVNNGGFGDTAGFTRFVRLDSPQQLRSLLAPNRVPWDVNGRYLDSADFSAVLAAREESLATAGIAAGLLPRDRRQMQSLYESLVSSGQLERFLEVLPEDASIAPLFDTMFGTNNTLQQAQLAVLAFKSGVAAAVDMLHGGFDTHADHDEMQGERLSTLTQSIDYLWSYAEEQGVADRLLVVIASDFGRTPSYNTGDGKDHWPIGSAIIMQKGAPWGNRVVGLTDGGHNAYRINPGTLQRDDANGTLIYPKHIHLALRNYLGIAAHPLTQKYPLNNTESFDFFNSALSTAGIDDDPRNSVRLA